MPGPKIFISYSARVPEVDQAAIDRDEPIDPALPQPDKEIADKLVEALKERGFDPWQDHRRLKTGQNWHKEISDNLRSCRGAIVLLSDISKTSPYVRHEVSFLSIRNDDEGEAFPFLPIWLGSELPDDLGEYFHAINLKRFQIEVLDYPEVLPIDHFAELLKPAKEASNCPTTAKELLEIQLASKKNLGSLDPAALRGVAKLRGWIGEASEDTWGHPQAVATLFARHLMAASMEEQFQALNDLGTLELEDRQRFFELVVPFWIEERAARKFSDCHEPGTGERAIVVKSTLPNFTPGMLARRHVANREWDKRTLYPECDSHTMIGRTDSLLVQALRSICHQLGGTAASAFTTIQEKLAEGKKLADPEIETRLQDIRTRIADKKILGKEIYSILTGVTAAEAREIEELRGSLQDVVWIIFPETDNLELQNCAVFDPSFQCDPKPPPEHNRTRHHESFAQKVYTLVRSELYQD